MKLDWRRASKLKDNRLTLLKAIPLPNNNSMASPVTGRVVLVIQEAISNIKNIKILIHILSFTSKVTTTKVTSRLKLDPNNRYQQD